MKAASCLSGDQIRRFAERRIDGSERQLVEGHAADCDACRGQLADAWRQRRRQSVAPVEVPASLRARVDGLVPAAESETGVAWWRRPLMLAPLATVSAAVVVAFLMPVWLGPPAVEPPVLRGDGGSPVEATAPADGAVIELGGRQSLQFSWRPATGFARFRLEVVDAEGRRVYEAETADPHQLLEPEQLGAGDYYWTVWALREDGSSLPSHRRHLRLVE